MAQISAPQSIGIPISSFPPKMQSQLAELDDSGDGIIGSPFPPPTLFSSFARHSFLQRARCRSWWIPNSEWKPDAFSPYSKDAAEVLSGVQALRREKTKSRQLTYLAVSLVAFALLLLLAMGGA
jgi:hypothetical protein